jgi:hypothetical protein
MSAIKHPPFSIKIKVCESPGVIKEIIVPRERLYISYPRLRGDIFYFVDERSGCISEYKEKNGEVCRIFLAQNDEDFKKYKNGITFNIEELK